MADRVWIGANGGDWADPANWQGTIVPGAGDDVTIQSTLAETITISTSETITSLVFDDHVGVGAPNDLLDPCGFMSDAKHESDRVGSQQLVVVPADLQ